MIVDIELNAGQKAAMEQIVGWADGNGEAISLTGAAGTGKTILLRYLLTALDTKFDAVILTAMTGKAALRISELLGEPATTFHSAFFQPPRDDLQTVEFSTPRPPPEGDVLLVIDEASMLSPDLYMKLREKWMAKGVRVLFVGDAFQLPPVMNKNELARFGANFSIFCEVTGPMLTQVMRSGDDVLFAATHLRETGRLLAESRGTYVYRQVGPVVDEAVGAYILHPEHHALVTWRNALRTAASVKIRAHFNIASPMPEPGEPLLVCKNGQQHLNGQIIPAGSFRAGPRISSVNTMWMKLDEPIDYIDWRGNSQTMVEVLTLADTSGQSPYFEQREDWQKYVGERKRQQLPEPLPITFGYSLTSHKSQGSEFDRVTLYLTRSDVFNRAFKAPSLLPDRREVTFGVRMLYTALTRAKTHATVLIGEG